jgi:hypothetical protein
LGVCVAASNSLRSCACSLTSRPVPALTEEAAAHALLLSVPSCSRAVCAFVLGRSCCRYAAAKACSGSSRALSWHAAEWPACRQCTVCWNTG